MKTRLHVLLLMVFLTGMLMLPGTVDSSDGRSRDTMAMVLDFGDYGVYHATPYPCFGENKPRFFIFSEASVKHILSAPADNAVATMDLRNALSLIRLKKGGRCGLEIVKKGFLDMVSGPFEFRYAPPWSTEEIGYTMTRGFVLANIRTRTVEAHTIIEGLEGEISRVHALNPQKRSFIFDCQFPTRSGVLLERSSTLKAVRFEGGKAIAIGAIAAGVEQRAWFVFQNHLFLFDNRSRKLDVWDDELKPARHPFADVFNEELKDYTKVYDVIFHPTLPLALVVTTRPKNMRNVSSSGIPESASIVMVLKWTEEKKGARLSPWFGTGFTPWGGYRLNMWGYMDEGPVIEFSPDGKWLLVRATRADSSPGEDYRLVVPVTASIPEGGGKPIELLSPDTRKFHDRPTARGSAWTRNPVSFVTANRDHLLQWDLDALNDAKWVRPMQEKE